VQVSKICNEIDPKRGIKIYHPDRGFSYGPTQHHHPPYSYYKTLPNKILRAKLSSESTKHPVYSKHWVLNDLTIIGDQYKSCSPMSTVFNLLGPNMQLNMLLLWSWIYVLHSKQLTSF